MSDFTERVKEVRNETGLTQTEFAESLGLSLPAYKNFEYAKIKNPNAMNPTIVSLCNKYNVNETWLRTGEGQMHGPLTRAQEIAQITAQLFHDDPSSERSALQAIICNASDDDIHVWFKWAAEWVDKVRKGSSE